MNFSRAGLMIMKRSWQEDVPQLLHNRQQLFEWLL